MKIQVTSNQHSTLSTTNILYLANILLYLSSKISPTRAGKCNDEYAAMYKDFVMVTLCPFVENMKNDFPITSYMNLQI